MLRNFLPGKRLKSLFLTGTYMLVLISSIAQPNTKAVYWLRYQNQLSFSKEVFWNNEIDNRRFIDPDVQTQLIIHSRLHYKKERWDYAGGLTFSWAYASQPENSIKHPTTEVRPVIEVSYEIPYTKWALHNRIRVDHRFFDEDRFETVFDGSTYVMRWRYRIQGRIPIKKSPQGKDLLNLRIADEIMVNDRRNLFDQNRIYATLDYSINKNWTVESGYIYIYQQRFGRDEFIQRHVLRFSLQHRLFLN